MSGNQQQTESSRIVEKIVMFLSVYVMVVVKEGSLEDVCKPQCSAPLTIYLSGHVLNVVVDDNTAPSR